MLIIRVIRIISKGKEEKVMSRLLGKAIDTLKNEGIKSLKDKTINYIKLRTILRHKIYFGDILIINGCMLPHPQRYRVDHQVEQLRASGLHADRINFDQITLDKIKYYRGFIFYRCPITSEIEEFIKAAKSENKAVFYDIDDLVIDKKYTDSIQFLGTMTE